MSNRLSIVILLLLFTIPLSGQECNYVIDGYVWDEASGEPLASANLILQESSSGSYTDETGAFTIENICPGHYHLHVSHIGCESERIHLELASDTTLYITLQHSSQSISTVVVKGISRDAARQGKSNIDRAEIEGQAHLSLSNILTTRSGVSALKNGTGISKPVVHGMYGNRLPILNNGVLQSGQQWGNDHAPEIDPMTADKITVIKGAEAIEYPGNFMGVILVEPGPIDREPHLHGRVNYIYETNGRGHTLNARLEKYRPEISWRLTGSLKNYGDRHTPDYYLSNTGSREYNLALQLEKQWQRLKMEFYASTFNTDLGILRGSHIGNIADLEAAFSREEPFFTRPNFSREVAAPSQRVGHHLIKVKSQFFIDDDTFLEWVLSGQYNQRKEFDVRRSGRTDIPALSLEQLNTASYLKFSKDFNSGLRLTAGHQISHTDNTNVPETGILPLIPDYIGIDNGIYVNALHRQGSLLYSAGLRLDANYQHALTITRDVPREIERFKDVYITGSGVGSVNYALNKRNKIGVSLAYVQRNPAINERFSNGLHQGVAGIEEGDELLSTEKATKATFEYEYKRYAHFTFNVLAYSQFINDYIFLNPQNELRTTIRGAFPVFRYSQTDATIYGLDFSTEFEFSEAFLGDIIYSYIRGRDRKNNIPLVNIPSDRLAASFTYRVRRIDLPLKKVAVENLDIKIKNEWVFSQENLLENQDYLTPPEAYLLTGVEISTGVLLPRSNFRLFMRIENILDIRYRNYLNRQRYFADEPGRSWVTGLTFNF